MNELISVIVPVYNVEKYIRGCIDSIIGQTYNNLEIIIVNDGSLDESGKICDEYLKKDNRIKVIHKENSGVSSARNIGIKNSTGKWIAFVDSDDWIEKNYFEELLKVAIENDAEVVLCGYNRITANKKEKIHNSGQLINDNSREFLIKILNPQTGYGFCHMKLYKKSIIKDNLFDTSLKVGEDALFNEKIALNITKACFLEKSLYNYRINPNSVVRKFDEEYAIKYLNSMKNNKNYLMQVYQDDNEIWQNYYNFVAFHVLLIAVNYCYNLLNKGKKSKKYLKEVCKYKEFKEGIEKSIYNNLSITRKITLFTIKHKLYFITSLICKFRNKQNNN